MSGIACIINFDGAPVAPGLIEKMTSAMAHCGPDGINHWVEGPAALGQCMLHTTPESLEETQPLSNEDASLVLVMDGRVDNWEKLRCELLGKRAVLRTRADAELVLRAYEVWGKDCLSHIEGDFALVIWDAKLRTAFCARDRVGNRPFNYRWNGKTLIVSSELHAILALPGVEQVFNEGLLTEYLSDEWFGRDETFWKGVMRLVAAHRMLVSAEGMRIEKYWQPDPDATLRYRTDEEYVEHYRELFADVVRRMSRSHLPVAYEVSGGLDSSSIFAMAEFLRRQQKLPAPAINGYTLDFHNDPDANELEFVSALAGHLGVPIHKNAPMLMPVTWYREWVEKYREFPGYPNGTMSIGLRTSARQNGSRVVVTGGGGDEWLGMPGVGTYYAEELSAGQWRNVFACLKADSREVGVTRALWWLCRYGAGPLLPEAIKAALRRASKVQRKPSILSLRLQEKFLRRRGQFLANVRSPVKRRGQEMQLEMLEGRFGSFCTLARELEARQASSLQLELRSPLFNEKIVQFAFSTPERLRSRGGVTKWLHRKAMKSILPDFIQNRKTKAVFDVVFRNQFDDVMKSELKERIVPRRAAWIQPEKGIAFCENYPDEEFVGWAEWCFWVLVCCDVLSNDQ